MVYFESQITFCKKFQICPITCIYFERYIYFHFSDYCFNIGIKYELLGFSFAFYTPDMIL